MLDPLAGRRDTRPALEWGGRVYTYRELDKAIDAWRPGEHDAWRPSGSRAWRPCDGDLPAVLDASELPTVEALICVCAAARRGLPVAVENPLARPHRESIPAGAFLLVATSGSTGNPRPLARTAASWFDSFPDFGRLTGITPEDRVLSTGPLHATMHLFAALHALWTGACVTDDPTSATIVHAVPAVLRDVVAAAPRLRTAVVAGIALDDGAVAAADGITIVEYYGSAEVSLVAARRVPEPLRLLDGVQARVRAGLLSVRSPYLVLDAPEWFPVGDLAELGPDGGLVVRGRGDGVVNVGGTVVVAEDVERVVAGVPGVAAVAVLGTAHRVLGEIVTAAVELEPSVDLASVRRRVRPLLSREAVPRRWVCLPALPRTASGKVARADLKNMLP